MKQINVKKLLLPNLPYVFIALYATKLGQAARLAPGADFSQKALHIMEGFATAFQSALPSFHPIDLCVGVAAALLIRLAVYVKGKNARKFRKNIEYGSARWGNAEDIKPYVDPTFANNVILTQTERLTMNSRPKDPKTARNKNVLVVGGSGSGKTRFFIKPNLMQLHSSYVVTDPKGSIVVECGKLLQRNQYKIKILNTINFKKSHHYNPFAYLHSEKDILKLVTTLIANTQGDGKSGDDFWRKAETLLYTALIGYIYYEAPVEEQNFATLIEMINTMEVREDDEDFKNPVDLMFEELAKREPHHFAVRQYAKYRLAAGKTAKSILISCGARLAPFDIQELREITAYDELELDTLGDRKTALFIIISDTDDTFNFLASMVYTQLFNLLCDKADDVYGGRLPVHVRCLIDECANIGQIPKLEKLMATIRSREISACLVLQAQSQLKALYKDNCDTIIGNCDKYCTTHLIRTAVVNELLLEAIKSVCDYALNNEAEFMAQVCSASEDRQEKAARSIRQRKQRNEKRTDELTRLIRKLYEDNVSGRLSDTLFEQMLRDFEAELSDLTEIVSQDQQELERISRETINAEKFLSLVRKYTDFSELTPAMINEFVEKILVHQAQGKGASRIQEIEIFFNFVGKVDIPHKEVELTEEEKAALAEQERRRAKKAEYNRRYMEKKRRQWKEQQEQEQAEQLPLAAEQKGEHIA